MKIFFAKLIRSRRLRISLKRVKHHSPTPPPIHDCDAVGGALV